MTRSGSHALAAFWTISNPLIVKMKAVVAARMKAITWFLVLAETKEPMARKCAGHEEGAEIAREDHAIVRIA